MLKEFAEIDPWDAEYEPEAKPAWKTYYVSIPKVRDMRLYVSVEHDHGMLHIEDISRFNDKSFKDMDWEERRDVYDYLIEWELAVWQRIGPEDSELFATKKLDDEFGY